MISPIELIIFSFKSWFIKLIKSRLNTSLDGFGYMFNWSKFKSVVDVDIQSTLIKDVSETQPSSSVIITQYIIFYDGVSSFELEISPVLHS